MALINCPECGLQISTEAHACPGCGYPMQPHEKGSKPALLIPSCYSCTRPATTRCHRCGTLSCALHLQSISMGESGYELRCEECVQNAKAWWVISIAIFGLLFLLMITGMCDRTSYYDYEMRQTSVPSDEAFQKILEDPQWRVPDFSKPNESPKIQRAPKEETPKGRSPAS